jgi:hypothetical protein
VFGDNIAEKETGRPTPASTAGLNSRSDSSMRLAIGHVALTVVTLPLVHALLPQGLRKRCHIDGRRLDLLL